MQEDHDPGWAQVCLCTYRWMPNCFSQIGHDKTRPTLRMELDKICVQGLGGVDLVVWMFSVACFSAMIMSSPWHVSYLFSIKVLFVIINTFLAKSASSLLSVSAVVLMAPPPGP